jgi:hypothetical protein
MSSTNEVPGIDHIFGEYAHLVNPDPTLYSGIVSLPPGARYLDEIKRVLNRQPLEVPDNGKKNMSEQGVMVAALQNLKIRTDSLEQVIRYNEQYFNSIKKVMEGSDKGMQLDTVPLNIPKAEVIQD